MRGGASPSQRLCSSPVMCPSGPQGLAPLGPAAPQRPVPLARPVRALVRFPMQLSILLAVVPGDGLIMHPSAVR